MKMFAAIVSVLSMSSLAWMSHADEHIATAKQELNTGTGSSRSIPSPIQNDNSMYPITDPSTGKPKSGWDGSYAELQIADAFGQCVVEVGGVASPGDGLPVWDPYSDLATSSVFAIVAAHMGEHNCPLMGTSGYPRRPDGSPVYPALPIEWVKRRSARECNIDPDTGEFRAAFEAPTVAATSMVPKFAAWINANTPSNYLRGVAYSSVRSAFTDLCVAQRLLALLDDPSIFAATSREHVAILGFAQERAKGATTALGKLVRISLAGGYGPIEYSLTSLIGTWSVSNPAYRPQLRADFQRAVKLATYLTTAFGAYLEREAGARSVEATASDDFQRDWGISSARNKLMRMVFGGDAIGNRSGFGGPPNSYDYFRKIREHGSDPVLMVLFGLARDADALVFLPTSGNDLDPESWQALYQDTELRLRIKDCVASGGADCTVAAMRSQVPPLTAERDYLLTRHYGVTLAHAKTLSTMLWDAAVKADFFEWWGNFNGKFHLSGHHTRESRWLATHNRYGIRLDPNTVAFPYAIAEYAERGQSLCQNDVPEWSYNLDYCTEYGADYPIAQAYSLVGALPSLAMAREVLVEMLPFASSAERTEVAATLKAVERLTGDTTVILAEGSMHVVQPEGTDWLDWSNACQPVDSSLSGTNVNLKAATRDPNLAITFSPTDVKGINSAHITYETTLSSEAPVEVATGRRLYLSKVDWDPYAANPNDGCTLLLSRRNLGSSYSRNLEYLATVGINSNRYFPPKTTIAYSGWFVDLVNRITAVQEVDWTRPKYDGFGLPTNWVPPADASLIGGSAGEESYAYLLRSAKSAAEEATVAVKAAIESLSEEARDKTVLEQAEFRASTIAGIEQQALCGQIDGCWFDTTEVNFRIADTSTPCSGIPTNRSTEGINVCRAALQEYNKSLVTEYVPAPVAEKLETPRLDQEFANSSLFEGSELHRVLIRIWNAARLLRESGEQAKRLATAAGTEYASALAALTTAYAAYDVREKEYYKLTAQLGLVNVDLKAQVDSINNTLSEANERLALAATAVSTYCDPIDQRCFESCVDSPEYGPWYCAENLISCNGWDGWEVTTVAQVADFCAKHTFCGREYGDETSGTFEAANGLCTDKSIAYKDAVIARDKVVKDATPRLAVLAAQGSVNQATTEETLAKRTEASEQRTAAGLQRYERKAQADVQIGAHRAVIQQLVGELKSALAEWKQLQSRAIQTESRAAVEVDLAKNTVASNYNIRRKYRNYDLWRAKSLLESTRRLAVAARRGIEARFVVDLSMLKPEQAFVASPSVWADEIYQSDLNAPEVVGLTPVPSSNGSVYPNKLVDYVGNLERFVQGYTITQPTSVSLPDTELLTLGGPDVATSATATAKATLAPDSRGWRFFCPDQNTWVPHSGAGEYPLTHRAGSICNGKAPSLAKIGFWLDSWGVMGGTWTRPQYTDRHNVRWRRLAVNLIGTGIRDCAKASDSMSCYTSPYIRFNMVHVGPSWQTNHAGGWRALDIPAAHIEGGKALAAEEWLEAISNSWNMPYVANVARGEFFGRPLSGNYELVLEITPEVRLDRIERVQLLVEQDYWVRQTGGQSLYGTP